MKKVKSKKRNEFNMRDYKEVEEIPSQDYINS
jgi:hypothetical protein